MKNKTKFQRSARLFWIKISNKTLMKNSKKTNNSQKKQSYNSHKNRTFNKTLKTFKIFN